MEADNQIMRVKISDLHLDQHNANTGTERGNYMLGHSLETLGAGRSILVDKNLNVVAGNKTLEKWADLGAEEIILIPNDSGKLLVGVYREDLDIYDDDDQRGRLMAYADNRVSEVNIKLNPERVTNDVAHGLDLSNMYYDNELAELEAQSDPEYLDTSQFAKVPETHVAYRVIIDNLTRDEAEELSEEIPESRVEMYRL